MSCSIRFLTIKLGQGTFVKSLSSLVYTMATFWNLESLTLKVSNSGDTDEYIKDFFQTITRVILPPRLSSIDCDFQRMIYDHKQLDWVSLFLLLMAKNRNRSIQNLSVGLVFFMSDDFSLRYMDALQEMISFNT
jgi:hypothetical protein